MRNLILAIAALFVLTACTATERGAVTGAAAGAVIGGVATGNARGAAVGAGVGGIAGALIGRASEPGQCRYRDRNGEIYTAAC